MREMSIKVNYKPLWKLMIDKEISMAELTEATRIAPSTFTKMKKNEFVSLEVLGRIAIVMNCKLDDLVSISSETNQRDSDVVNANE
jgi:putative transcriptional regulator